MLGEVREGEEVTAALRLYPLPQGGYIAKSILVAEYRRQIEGETQKDNSLLERIRMKPIRSLSGVTTVTVLTKPYPCPGKCIFCPDDVRMPKSYLVDEPGASRAFQNNFDPYLQVNPALIPTKPLGIPPIRLSCSSWAAHGALTAGITRKNLSNAATTP